MKNKRFKKALSVFLSILMLMSCWVWVAPTDAEAANKYYVKVYVNIYDGSDGYGGTYQVDTATGKPANYSWATSDGWYGRINMTGFTVFGEDGDYDAQDVSAALIEAENLGTYYAMDGLSDDNANGDWDSKAIATAEYTFTLDSFPVEIFWINDENNWDGGNTGFAIRKLTVATSEGGTEHTMWEGLAGSDSETYNYYGSISPTGIHTCFEDGGSENISDYAFYKAITTSSQRAWSDPYSAGSYGTYYVNDYQSGGVSATFSEGVESIAYNVDYINTGSTDTYYMNFINHSKTQSATIVGVNNSDKFVSNPAGTVLAPGEKKSFALTNISSLGGDDGIANFCFNYTLDNVYASDALDASLAQFYQPCYIGTWNASDDSKQISDENGDGNTGFSLYKADNYTWGDNSMTIINTFQTTEGILERNSATSGDGTDNATFNYNYYIDTTGITNWTQTGLRFHVKESQYYTLSFQPADYTSECGTITMGGTFANPNEASITIADIAYSSITEEFQYNHDQASGFYTYADYYTTGTPMWNVTQADNNASFYNNSEGWFRFAGNMIKGSGNSAATINFSNMTYRERQNGQKVYFSGTINVYAFDKTTLRDYVRETLIDFAPMKERYDATAFSAYETALSNAMKVLAKQKTTQNEIDTALAELKSAVEALQTTDNLINQIDTLSHVQYVDDVGSAEAASIAERYVLIPLGEHTVPQNTAYIGNGTYKDLTNKNSNLTTNYTKDDTAIDVLNYYYWNIDYSEVNGAITDVQTAIDTVKDDSSYSDDFKQALEDAKAELEAIDQTTTGDSTPLSQEEIDNVINEAKELVNHVSDSHDNCVFDGDDEDTDADIVNENYNCIDGGTVEHVCIICGKAQVVEIKDPQEGGHTLTYVNNSDGTHTATCTECDFSETADHVFTNPVLVRPTLVDGAWVAGSYTYTCICGATKTEAAERADYSEFENAVAELEELNKNENLTDDAKAEIAEALEKAEDLADNLVTAEQSKIDELVKELQDVKADVEKAISEVVGSKPVTDADSGIKVNFLKATGVDTVEYVQLGTDGGFETVRMRLTNGNENLPITVTSVVADNAYIGADDAASSAVFDTATILDKNGGSKDLYIVAPAAFNEAGIITYTITYTIDGLMDADGNPVEFTTKAYLYVKAAAYVPHHYMDERVGVGSETSEWDFYLESTNYGDFVLVHDNKAPYDAFGNTNLIQDGAGLFDYVREQYDYENDGCYAGCADGTYHDGDAHAATYRYYIDTSLAPTYEAAGLRARFVENEAGYYDNAPLKYVRLANNQEYLDRISGTDKTFSVTFLPSASGTQGMTWTATSNGDMTVSQYDNPDQNNYIFGYHHPDEGCEETTAYANFAGAIPQNTTEAKLMFSPRMEFNGPNIAFAEAVTMTTHLYITSYDKAELREAVANAETAGYNSEYYDETKYEAYENALKNAKEVLGKAETNQDEIDAATEALNNAIADLTAEENEAKFVLTVTHSIHENADKNSEATGTEYDYYLVNGDVTPALKADVIALDTINKYDSVVTLNVTADATHTYNYWYIDYSGVQDAIDAADAIIKDTTTGYSDEYKAEVEEAKTALEEINKTNADDSTTTPESQDDVDNAIGAVTDLTGHDCVAGEVVVENNIKPKCEEPGSYENVTYCTKCGKELSREEVIVDAINHNYDIANAKLIARPELVDGEWTTGTYEATCLNDESHKLYLEGVQRADYSAFDAAVAELKELAEYENFTDEVKAEIIRVATELENGTYDPDGDGKPNVPLNYVDDYIYNDVTIPGEQATLDSIVEELKVLVDEIEGNKTNENFIKPDYTGIIAEWEEYLALVEQYGGEVTYGTEGDSLTATVVEDGYIKDATNTEVTNGFSYLLENAYNSDSATAADWKDKIAEMAAELADINDGIVDGTLRDPNFEAYDAEVKTYNEKTSTVNVSADDKATVKAAMDIVDAIKANLDATAKDSDATIATQTAIIKAINDKYANCVDGNHDYADATCTTPKTCSVCGATDGEALDHAWTVTYEWSNDNSTCTATRVCGNDSTHNVSETVAAAVTTTDGTCIAEAKTTYTADFEAAWAEDQTEVVTGELGDHSWKSEPDSSVPPVYDEETKKWSQGVYTYSCNNCPETVTIYADRADYSEYDALLKAYEDIVNDDEVWSSLTDETIDDLTEFKKKLDEIAQDYTKATTDAETGITTPDGQAELDALLEGLDLEIEAIQKSIEDGSGRMLDFTEFEEAVSEYEGDPDDGIDATEDIASAEDRERITNLINETRDLANLDPIPNADSEEQKQIDAATEEIRAIIEKYAYCLENGHTWGEWVENVVITEGTFETATYTRTCEKCGKVESYEVERENYDAYDDAVTEAEELLENEDLTDAAKEIIQNALDEAKELDQNLPADIVITDDEGNEVVIDVNENAEAIKDTTDALNEVIDSLYDENGELKDEFKKIDYTKYDNAVEAYENLKDTMTDADKAAVEAIKAPIDAIPEDGTAAQYQTQVDEAAKKIAEINAKYGGCAEGNHKWGAWELTTAPTKETEGEYTRICEICGATETMSVERENYDAYDDAVTEAEDLIKNEDLTDAAKTEIQEALDKAKELDQKLPADAKDEDGNVVVDNTNDETIADATAALTEVLDKIKNDETGAYLKPDYTEWDAAEGTYDALDKTNVKAEIINEANDLKAEIAGKQADDTLTQATATQDDIDAATDRLNDIIDGIKDGSLKDPDYSAVEDKLEQANNAEGLNKDTQDKIDAIEEALEEIKGRTEPEANYRDNQGEVDALEDQLDEILDSIADGTAKAPNYAEWDAAEGTYDALDKTNVPAELITEATNLKSTIDALKDDPTANATDDQETVDDATKRLNEIIAEINGILTEKPDFSGYDGSHDTYEELVEQYGDKIKDSVADDVAALDTIVDGVRDDETATKIEDQPTVDNAKTELDKIIEGIEDGSLRDPDYSKVEEKLEEADNTTGLNQDTQDKIDAIKDALEEIKNRTEPEANAKDDQDEVDALEDQLDEILDSIADGTAKAPNYAEWDAAEGTYDALDKTNVPAELITEATNLKSTIDALKDDPTANATDDQETVDDATKRLNEIIAEINGILTEKPDFSGYDGSHDTYEELVEQYGDKIKDSVADDVAALDTIVDGVRDDETATKIEDQPTVDNAKTELDKIIEGIQNGTLLDPDYTEVDKDLADAKDKAENNDVIDGVKEDIQEIEDALNDLRKDPTTNANDQDTIDALEKELEEIIAGIEDGTLINKECTHTDCAIKIVEPTCHSIGYTLHVCKKCGHAYRTDEVPANDDHNWGRWVEIEGVSCLEHKTRGRSCLNEGCYEKQIEVVRDANGNALYGKHVLVVIDGKAATCTTPGYTDYTRCTVCGEISESVEIPAKGHIDSNGNGNCDVCNFVTNPATGKCDCLCHNNSFFGKLLFNIVNFFWKIFKIQQGCQCGAQHW